MRNTLKKLGFTDVEETAIGATIVKKAYDDMLEEDRDVIISSCCHSINMLIKRHHPACLPYLADVLSPMLAHGKDIKLRYGEDTKVVFIGPCIAKKDESDKNRKLVDAVLTYRELDEWLKEENISLETTESKEQTEKSKARLFPTNGGILKTMECRNREGHRGRKDPPLLYRDVRMSGKLRQRPPDGRAGTEHHGRHHSREPFRGQRRL